MLKVNVVKDFAKDKSCDENINKKKEKKKIR